MAEQMSQLIEIIQELPFIPDELALSTVIIAGTPPAVLRPALDEVATLVSEEQFSLDLFKQRRARFQARHAEYDKMEQAAAHTFVERKVEEVALLTLEAAVRATLDHTVPDELLDKLGEARAFAEGTRPVPASLYVGLTDTSAESLERLNPTIDKMDAEVRVDEWELDLVRAIKEEQRRLGRPTRVAVFLAGTVLSGLLSTYAVHQIGEHPPDGHRLQSDPGFSTSQEVAIDTFSGTLGLLLAAYAGVSVRQSPKTEKLSNWAARKRAQKQVRKALRSENP